MIRSNYIRVGEEANNKTVSIFNPPMYAIYKYLQLTNGVTHFALAPLPTKYYQLNISDLNMAQIGILNSLMFTSALEIWINKSFTQKYTNYANFKKSYLI